MKTGHLPCLAAAMLALLAASRPHAEPGATPADALADVLAQPVYGGTRLAAASKYEQDAVEAPSMVYVRTGGEIRAQGYRTLAEVLESLPGTHLRRDRSYTYLGVRGVERPGDYASRLLLLIDGVRVNESIYDSATPGSEFPLDVGLIDRVEFIPGPGSALYGSNAVLGVVNVVTRGVSQRPGLNAGLEFGSGARRKVTATWGGDAGAARLLLGAARERSRGDDLYFPAYDSPATNRGVAVGRDGERNDKLFAKLRLGELNLMASLSDRLKSDPTGAYGVLFNTRSESIDRIALTDLSYARRVGASGELFARLGLAAYQYRGYGLYGAAAAPVPGTTRSDGRWLSGELRHVWSGLADHRVLLGLEFQDNQRQHLFSADLDPAPQVFLDTTLHSSRWSVFVNDEWQLVPRLRLNLGLRADRQLDGKVVATPRFAALWSAHADWIVKLQRGSAFREPNAAESGFQDSLQASGGALRAESLRATELTALWRPSPRFDLSASLHRLDLADTIEFVDLPNGQQQYVNAGGARAQGVEVEATWQPGAATRLRASWARQRTEARPSDQDLTDAPRSLVKLMAVTAGPWPGSSAALNVVRVGERLTLGGARLAPYLRVNTRFNLAPPNQRWSCAVSVYNLTARRYEDPAGPEHRQDTLIQDGRQFRVQFGWAF